MIQPNALWQQWSKTKQLPYMGNVDTNNLLDFSSGDNAFSSSLAILDTLNEIQIQNLSKFPDSNGLGIKKVMAKKFNVNESMITLGNGSDEIIESVARIFIDRGDKFLVIVPTFFRFIDASMKAGGKPIVIRSAKSNFKFTREIINEVLETICLQQPKIIWLCSPNNPTGEVMNLKDIREIVSASKGLVVIDEVYLEFIDLENKSSALKLLTEFENVLILKTLSKGFGLAGIRFGFALSNPEIIQVLESWRLPFNINSLTQKIAMEAFRRSGNLTIVNNQLKKERKRLFTEIIRLKKFIFAGNSQTNLFLLKHEVKDIFKELVKMGILAADFRRSPGVEGMGFVRLTIRSKEENNALLQALKKIA